MNKEKVQKTFADWPGTNRFWVTSDGECFFTEPRAIKHANTLNDKSIQLIRKADLGNLPAQEVKAEEQFKEPTFSPEAIADQAEDPKPVKAKTTKKTK